MSETSLHLCLPTTRGRVGHAEAASRGRGRRVWKDGLKGGRVCVQAGWGQARGGCEREANWDLSLRLGRVGEKTEV